MSVPKDSPIALPAGHSFVWLAGAPAHIARIGPDGQTRTTLCGQDRAHAAAWIPSEAGVMDASDVCHYCQRRWLDRAAEQEPP